MNPTREQFELAARAVGIVRYEHITLSEGGKSALWVPDSIFSSYQSWQPHIPGIDNAMLTAALRINTDWANSWALAMSVDEHQITASADYADFHGTETERRARAMAFAVFLVAVEIGRGMK